MTVSEALCIAEQAFNATKHLSNANPSKETIALIVLAQTVRSTLHHSQY